MATEYAVGASRLLVPDEGWNGSENAMLMKGGNPVTRCVLPWIPLSIPASATRITGRIVVLIA